MNIQAPTRPGTTSAAAAAIERELIELFVHVADLVGLPRSVGELYGCLFIASSPLTMDDLMRRLGLSKGATSQGLRLLRSVGAVRTVYVPGDRRDHFAAERELRPLVAGFLREKVLARLRNSAERLEAVRAVLREVDPAGRAVLDDRVRRLARWHQNARQVLPLLLKVIEP